MGEISGGDGSLGAVVGMKAHIGVDLEGGFGVHGHHHGGQRHRCGELTALLRKGRCTRMPTSMVSRSVGPSAVASRPAGGELREVTRHVEYLKAAIRSTVEHPFRVSKRPFG